MEINQNGNLSIYSNSKVVKIGWKGGEQAKTQNITAVYNMGSGSPTARYSRW